MKGLSIPLTPGSEKAGRKVLEKEKKKGDGRGASESRIPLCSGTFMRHRGNGPSKNAGDYKKS